MWREHKLMLIVVADGMLWTQLTCPPLCCKSVPSIGVSKRGAPLDSVLPASDGSICTNRRKSDWQLTGTLPAPPLPVCIGYQS